MELKMSSLSKKQVDQIDTILEKNTARGGLSVGVASTKAQHPWPFQAGYADIINRTEVTKRHLFGIGSITKVFVAVVILQLREEGRLALNDTVDEYLKDEITYDIENAPAATIEQLLNHTAGIDSWEDDPDWIAHGRGRLVKPEHVWTKTEPLDYIRRPRRTAPSPGNWGYANTNYTLLGLIIEKITHNTAELEIRRRILDPLNLQHTYLEGFETSDHASDVAGRYHLANSIFRETAGICPAFPEIDTDLIEAVGYNMSTSWLAGGMISNTNDLVKFAGALRLGKLLKPESTALMQHWIPTTIKDHEMGLGLFRMTTPSGRWLGHSGGVLGFTAYLLWHEQKDCCVAVLGNVGIVHTGGASISVKRVVNDTDFLDAALQLTESEDQ